MVISKQLLLLQGATFCHLIFMQNLTERLFRQQRTLKWRAGPSVPLILPLESRILCCLQLRNISESVSQNMAI